MVIIATLIIASVASPDFRLASQALSGCQPHYWFECCDTMTRNGSTYLMKTIVTMILNEMFLLHVDVLAQFFHTFLKVLVRNFISLLPSLYFFCSLFCRVPCDSVYIHLTGSNLCEIFRLRSKWSVIRIFTLCS